jgi:hypothetical protein
MNIYNGNLDEISIGQVILTDRDIYRKLSNINGTYDLYLLEQLDTHFVWSKLHDKITLNGSEIMDMSRLSYTIENTFNNVIKELVSFLTIYKVDENNTLTQTATFNGSYDIPLYWKDLSSEYNVRLINKYVVSKSLKDLPTHIDLTRECSDDEGDECPNDDYDHILGWDDLVINDVWCTLDNEADNEANDNEADNEANDNEADNEANEADNEADNEANDNIQDDQLEEDVHLEDKYEEERVDPFNGKWYTESEFINYYGGKIEWDHMEPKKILLREEYFRFTNNYSYLDTDKFIFLFKKYEKTFC